MKLYLILFSSFIILLIACKKSKLQNVTITPGSVDSLSYQPSVYGSTWIYDVKLNGVKTGTKTVVCQNYDTVINSKQYDVFLNNDSSKEFIRKDSTKYYNVLTASSKNIELCVLDVSKNINDTWIGGINGSDTYYYTITEKKATFVQNGINLKNVITVYTERKDTNGNVTLSGTSIYAQGVGNINSSGKIGSIPTEVILTSAEIK